MGYKSRPNGYNINICMKFDCKNKDKKCGECIRYSMYNINIETKPNNEKKGQ